MLPTVTICIPTYAAEAFIESTIAHALAQTYPSIRIVISVDLSEDRTLEICQAAARRDPRIEVLAQKERLGWSRNANAALERADTEFGSIYFHDDRIDPLYVERLVRVLEAKPDAASAHCDLAEFGLIEAIRKAHDYRGSTVNRLADFMLTRRGTTLRSMMRLKALPPGVRFPFIEGDRRWAAYYFHMALLAAGPALAVRETLYHRWQRPGSLTRSADWRIDTINDSLQGWNTLVPLCGELFDRSIASTEERSVAFSCLDLFRRFELAQDQLSLRDLRPLNQSRPNSAAIDAYSQLNGGVLDPEIEHIARCFEREVEGLETKLARLRGAAGAPGLTP